MARRIRTSTRVNIADFDKRMETLAQRVVRRSNDGVKEVSKASVQELIRDTPKLTNQAAANWQVSIGNSPTLFKKGFTDLSAAQRLAEQTIDKREAGQVVNISNNAPYIGTLNRGSSTQAPSNFVQKALLRARLKVRAIRLLAKITGK